MPPSKKTSRFALAAVVAAMLPSVANALALVDVENFDSYAGMATVTVTKASPGGSGKNEEVSSFGMAWIGAGSPYAYATSVVPGLSLFMVDFRSVFPSNAPPSLGWNLFSLDREQADLAWDDFDIRSPFIGDPDDVLPLASAATDYGVWEEIVSQKTFSATFRLFLFDASGIVVSPSDVSVVTPAAVPEPGLLALLGIGLGGLAATCRRKMA